jgi:hypothetical protein
VKVILRRSLGMEVAWLKAPVPSDVRALIRALISLSRGSDYSKRRRRARPAAGAREKTVPRPELAFARPVCFGTSLNFFREARGAGPQRENAAHASEALVQTQLGCLERQAR